MLKFVFFFLILQSQASFVCVISSRCKGSSCHPGVEYRELAIGCGGTHGALRVPDASFGDP